MPRTISYQSYFDYGTGVDTIREAACGRAVGVETARPVQGAGGQSSQFRIDMLESQQKFQSSLNIAASASLNYGLEALRSGGSVNAKFDFAEENTFSEYHLNILTRVRVENPTLIAPNPQLTRDASNLYAKDQEAFHERYGDSFVSGLHTGGEFFGLIIIETRDRASKERIHANLAASGAFGAWSGSLSVDVTRQELESSSSKRTKVLILRSGAGGRIESDVKGMIEMARNFPSSVTATSNGLGWPFAVDLTEYKLLKLPQTANPFDLERKHELLTYLGRQRSEALSKLKQCQYILANPDEFTDMTSETLESVAANQRRLAERIDAIYAQASQCFNDYRHCSFAKSDFVVPAIQLPERKLEIDSGTEAGTEMIIVPSFIGADHWDLEEAARWAGAGVTDASTLDQGRPRQDLLTAFATGNWRYSLVPEVESWSDIRYVVYDQSVQEGTLAPKGSLITLMVRPG